MNRRGLFGGKILRQNVADFAGVIDFAKTVVHLFDKADCLTERNLSQFNGGSRGHTSQRDGLIAIHNVKGRDDRCIFCRSGCNNFGSLTGVFGLLHLHCTFKTKKLTPAKINNSKLRHNQEGDFLRRFRYEI